ncbi:carotenoid 1,2-hydratase [Roseinatronobacter sp. S2]|uniref:carotenoid 1,2-hydratase n=1 Tax=Roseinatronobacter sp. S2 TaxID=3035471 RepID=UPI0024106795|nr:carotenoid 1,2-hydratase [Roseinatronobacter sp. S2]WFE76980.1 carotenoid 1,2-hydratase [Roseinatronobacter sp. S2]
MGFIGSVFSPWYRWSGRRDPQNHCCINVATYGSKSRFTMTDRGRTALRQSPDMLQVGPSSMRWDGDKLLIDVNEVSSPPLVSRVRGTITLHPEVLFGQNYDLTPDGRHRWQPFAPIARIDVALDPGHHWSGHGYFDSNYGTHALEDDFNYWTWGRFPHKGGTRCFYDAILRNGQSETVALHFHPDGRSEHVVPPPRARIARSLWAVRRETRADAGFQPRQELAMLDAPFYTRSAMRTCIDGEQAVGVHEALNLRRYAQPLLKPMLALRVPRRARWNFTAG